VREEAEVLVLPSCRATASSFSLATTGTKAVLGLTAGRIAQR